MTELAKEVRLAASYGELSETLQQRIEVVMRFFLALGEGVDTPAEEEPRMKVPRLCQRHLNPASTTT